MEVLVPVPTETGTKSIIRAQTSWISSIFRGGTNGE